jgi:hypothetical protein
MPSIRRLFSCLSGLSGFWLNETNQMNQTNQINRPSCRARLSCEWAP